MKPPLRPAFLAWLALPVLAACGGFQSYRLPLSGDQGRATFAPLAACATARSFQAVEHPDSLNVRYDGDTWVQYMVQGEQFNMVILIGKGVPEPERPARAQAAKAAGDQLFQCATNPVYAAPVPAPTGDPLAAAANNLAAATMNAGAATMNAGAATMNAGAATMNAGAATMNAGAQALTGGECGKVVTCYGELARDLCPPQGQCSFRVEINGNDPAACRRALDQVPQLVQPFGMVRPGYAIPASCR